MPELIEVDNPSTGAITKNEDLPRVVIFTAIPVEYSAVRDHLENLEEKEHPCGTIYEQGIFSSGDREWNVGIVETGQGNEQAALEVERAIQYFSPSIALFVGVAGGVKDVQLGDVVVASKVYGYESGKAGENFDPRPEAFTPDYKLVNRARAEARKDNWLQRLGTLVPNPHPNVFIKPIAAGAKVLSYTRSEAYNLIKSSYGDTLAVEMEGYGFLRAAHANSHVSALIIRGISDLIDKKENADKAGFQEIASRHASAFAFEVLAKSYIKPIYSEQHDHSQEIITSKSFTSPSTGMKFVLIPAGEFMMGSTSDEEGGYYFEYPAHEVTIKDPFYMGKYPVTQKQWKELMNYNPSRFKGENLPVEYVSWEGVQIFIKELNEKENTKKYRLPSEAEWEYACRADTQTRNFFGDDGLKLNEYTWHKESSGTETHITGYQNPNHLGIYEIHGNAWEWVQDMWHSSYNGAPSDGTAWEDEDHTFFQRVIRNGNKEFEVNPRRSSFRSGTKPEPRGICLGFRLVRDI